MLMRQTVQRIAPPNLILFALAGAAGCSVGGQSTDEGTCPPEVVTQLVSDTQATELGFSVSDLSWAWGSETLPGHWLDAPERAINNASSETVVHLTLARTEGSAVVKDSGWCGGPRLVVPAELHVTTSDGLVDEILPTELEAARVGFATLVAPLSFEGLHGSLAVTSTSEGVELVQPAIRIALTPNGLSGTLDAILQRRHADSVSSLPGLGGQLLQWPSDALCSTPLVQSPLDVASSPWSHLNWTQGEWRASAATPADGASYDVSIETATVLCEAASTDTSVPARIQIAALDGNWFTIEGSFVDDGTGLQFAPSDWLRASELALQFNEHFSEFELSLEGYDEVSLELSVTLTNDQATGALHINGYRDECNVTCDSNGCNGCGPMTKYVLLTLDLGPV